MTEDQVVKYTTLLSEFSHTKFGQQERAGLLSFLERADVTEKNIATLIKEYQTKMDNDMTYLDCIKHSTFHWVFYLEAFERKGTIRSGISHEEIVVKLREFRHRTYVKEAVEQ